MFYILFIIVFNKHITNRSKRTRKQRAPFNSALYSHGINVFESKLIEKELERLTTIHENGGGFGDPDAKAEHERKIDLLKHKQLHAVSKNNNRIAIFNIIIAIINIGILIYQVFYV